MRGGSGVALCVLVTVLVPAWGLPRAAAASAGKGSDIAAVTLPTAHAGQPYYAILSVVSTISYGRAQCTLDNSPAWLTFDQEHFQFSGIPEEKALITTYAMKLTMTDTDSKKTQVLNLTLRIVNGPEIAYADPKLRPKPDGGTVGVGGPGRVIAPDGTEAPIATGGVAAPPKLESPASAATPPGPVVFEEIAPELKITSQVLEGSTSISGEVVDIPLGAMQPVVEVWISPKGRQQEPYQAQLTTTDAEGNPSKAVQIPLGKNGRFTAGLISPLTAGETVLIKLVSPQGSGLILKQNSLSSRKIVLPTDIPTPEIYVSEDLTVGTQSITGHVEPLAQPPIPGITANAANNVAATPGNLPSISVEISDPQNGKSFAGLQLSLTDTETAVQVGADGSFSLRLAKPLSAGQNVRLVAVAPKGHYFSGPDRSRDPQQARNSPINESAAYNGRNIQKPVHGPLKVYTALAISEPVITSALEDGISAISGTATASATGSATVNIAVLKLREGQQLRDGACPTSDDLNPLTGSQRNHDDYQLLTGTDGTTDAVATGTNGAFSLTLATPLHEGERIQIVQVLPPGSSLVPQQRSRCFSRPYEVPAAADWGRVRADFTAGILMSNNSATTLNVQNTQSQDNGDFSQAHEFLDLNVDKSWSLPACYLRSFADEDQPHERIYDKHHHRNVGTSTQRPHDGSRANNDECYDWHTATYAPAERWQHLWPGVNTYFDARLTSIPVSELSTTTSTSTASSTSSTVATSPTSVSPVSNQLTSAQTARLGVGIYFPFLITRWDYRHEPNALFFAPLAKVGFDTVTGPSSQTVIVPSGGVGSINLENLYNFYAFGGRIGHFHMTDSLHSSPQTYSYIDVVIGPFSNLQSFICKRTPAISTTTSSGTAVTPVPGYPAPSSNAGSSCLSDYPAFYSAMIPAGTITNLPAGSTAVYEPFDSRKRLYRLDIEGLLKIPSTPLYVGFNANIGQRTVGADHLDHGYAAPDDLRFLFGTRFDIGTALSKMGINPF